jgi:hypothetical protein
MHCLMYAHEDSGAHLHLKQSSIGSIHQLCVHVNTHICVCMYVYMYVCVCVCVDTHLGRGDPSAITRVYEPISDITSTKGDAHTDRQTDIQID